MRAGHERAEADHACFSCVSAAGLVPVAGASAVVEDLYDLGGTLLHSGQARSGGRPSRWYPHATHKLCFRRNRGMRMRRRKYKNGMTKSNGIGTHTGNTAAHLCLTKSLPGRSGSLRAVTANPHRLKMGSGVSGYRKVPPGLHPIMGPSGADRVSGGVRSRTCKISSLRPLHAEPKLRFHPSRILGLRESINPVDTCKKSYACCPCHQKKQVTSINKIEVAARYKNRYFPKNTGIVSTITTAKMHQNQNHPMCQKCSISLPMDRCNCTKSRIFFRSATPFYRKENL